MNSDLNFDKLHFLTSELSLAAALLAWGFTLDSIDKTSPNKVIFIFSRSSELDQAIQAFWNYTGQVSPKTYFNALREAKSRIYGG